MSQQVSQPLAKTAKVAAFLGSLLPAASAANQINTAEVASLFSTRNTALTQIEIETTAIVGVIKIGHSREVGPNLHKGNLFIKGEVNMSAEKQTQLSQWLATEHPNWIVVIMDSARGEQYRDPNGIMNEGTLAADWQLSMDASRLRANFDERGALLMIVTDDRREGLRYKSGALYDNNGVGEENWINGSQLIKFAQPGMRNGLNTYQAVSETVREIDDRLYKILDAQRAQEAKLEKDAQAALNNAEVIFDRLNTGLREFKETYSDLSGDIANPNLGTLNTQLSDAKSLLADQQWDTANKMATNLSNDINRIIEALDAYSLDAPRFQELKAQITKVRSDNPRLPTIDEIVSANTALNEAEQSYSRGESSYAIHLKVASNAVSSLPTAVGTFYKDSERLQYLKDQIAFQSEQPFSEKASHHLKDAAENLKLAKDNHYIGDYAYKSQLAQGENLLNQAETIITKAQKMHSMRQTSLGLLITLVTIVSGAYLVLRNRRAMASKKLAQDEVEHWRSKIQDKSKKLLELVKERDFYVGSTKNSMGFQGKTQKIAEQIHLDSVKLIELLELIRARQNLSDLLMKPGIRGWFSGSSYLRAKQILGNEKLSLEGELIVSTSQSGKGNLSNLLATNQDANGENKSQSFNQIIGEFDATAAKLVGGLDQIRGARNNLETRLGEQETQLKALNSRAEELKSKQSVEPRLDLLSPLSSVIKWGEQNLSQAKQKSKEDPVLVFAEINQNHSNFTRLIEIADDAIAGHNTIVPTIKESQEKLVQSGRSKQWIDQRFMELSKLASQRFDDAMLHPPIAARKPFKIISELENIQALTNRAVGLEEERSGKLNDQIGTISNLITNTRSGLAKDLNIDENLVLHEPDHNPDIFYSQAVEQRELAATLIDQGKLDEVRKALDSAAGYALMAERATTNTKNAHTQFPDSVENYQKFRTQLAERELDSTKTLKRLQENYDTKILQLGQGDPSHPRENDTINDNLTEIDAAMQAAAKAIKFASTQRAQGRILQAALAVEHAVNFLQKSELRIQEISDKDQRVNQTEIQNSAKLENLLGTVKALTPEFKDRSVTAKTQSLFSQAQESLREVTEKHLKKGSNPFELEQTLDGVRRQFVQVHKQIGADRSKYLELGTSILAAENKIAQTKRKLDELLNDQVADSPEIDQTGQQLPKLSRELAKLRELHQDGIALDWYEIDEKVDDVTAVAADLYDVLIGQERASQEALNQIKLAKREINGLTGWSSSYGVRIDSGAGKDQLKRAQEHFSENGVAYATVVLLAREALSAAQQAWHRAQAKEATEKAAEMARVQAERAARERREREEAASRRRRSSYSSSSSSFGTSSSKGSGSFGGGFGGSVRSGSSGGGW